MKLRAVVLVIVLGAACVDEKGTAELEARIEKLERERLHASVYMESLRKQLGWNTEVDRVLDESSLFDFDPPAVAGDGLRRRGRINWWCVKNGPCSRKLKDCDTLRKSIETATTPCEARRVAYCGPLRMSGCVSTLDHCNTLDESARKTSPDYGGRCVGVE